MPELVHVEVDEVSVVDRPAIRRKFLLYKRDGKGDGQMPKRFGEKGLAAITDRLNKAGPQEDAVLAEVERLHKAANKTFGEEERDRALALLSLSEAEGDPVQRGAAVAAAMGVAKATSADDMKCKKCGAQMAKADAFCAKCGEKVAKAEGPADNPQPPDLDAFLKSDSPVARSIAEIVKANTDLRKANEDLTKRVSGLEDDKAKTTALAKAEAIGLPSDRTKLADLIQKAEAAGFGSDLESFLKATATQVRASALFGELGSSQTGEGSAYAKMESLAEQLVTKSTTGLTKEQALAEVGKQHPELYREYQAERKGGVS